MPQFWEKQFVPVIAPPGLIMSPEPPKWRVSKNRPNRSKEGRAQVPCSGDADFPFVSFETEETTSTIKAEQEAHAPSSYVDILKIRGNGWRHLISITLRVFSAWSGNGICWSDKMLNSGCMPFPLYIYAGISNVILYLDIIPH
jgi:hypothetical protein